MKLLQRATVGVLAASVVILVTAAPAVAAPSDQDQTWIIAAHQSNLAEIAAGTAAQQSAAGDGVRSMGGVLIADHQALDADLTALAQQLGVELPAEPTAEQQAALAQVQSNQGDAFDAAWIASQIDGHRTAAAAGAEEIANGSDASVTALAQAAAPVVQRHLDDLQQMAGQAPGSVPSGTSPVEASPLLGIGLAGAGVLALGLSFVLVRRARART